MDFAYVEVGVKRITPVYQDLTGMINKAYKFHQENYQGEKYGWGDTRSFQADLLEQFGIELEFQEKAGSGGKAYELSVVNVHNEKKYTMFMLRWSS